MWLGSAAGVALVLLGYHFFAGRKLDAQKEDLLAKQRAVDKTVGAEWYPLRDKLEKITVDSALAWPDEDFVDTKAKEWDFRTLPGLYLRLRVTEAKDVSAIRKNALGSFKDGFSGCLLREANPVGARGDADGGLGVAPDQPWNLRQAYTATRILTNEWVDEVRGSTDDLRLRVFEEQYRKDSETVIPVAIEIVKRAQFFLLVLDEDTPEAMEKSDGGPISAESLQRVPHNARVRIVDLKTGGDLAHLRKAAHGSFVMAGGQLTDPEATAAVERQVQSCSLALEVQEALGLKK